MDAPKELALTDILKTVPKGSRILDVGFGDALFLKSLIPHGYKLAGTEVSSICIRNAQKTLDGKVTLIHGEHIPPGADVICCFEVIEHLENPLEFLESLPRSILYLSTPNPHRWFPEITKLLLGRPFYEKWDDPPNHLRRYERSELLVLLEESGYTSIEITSTKVQHHTILSSLVRRKNTDNYDDMRPKHPGITKTVRRLFIPITFLMSTILNLLNFKGGSYSVKARK